MKRVFKIICISLIITIICLTFGGCGALDDIRETRITLTEKGSILYDDHEYSLLPQCEYLNPYFNISSPLLYLADEEVPLLLTSIFCTEHSISADKKFISAGGETPQYYCRDDIYDDIIGRISSGFKPDGYCYEYYDFDAGKDMLYLLKDSETEAIRKVLKDVTPTLLPDIANVNYEVFVALDACSSDLYFRNYAYNIYLLEGKYYLQADSGEQYLIYTVPDELNENFKGILKFAVDSEYY